MAPDIHYKIREALRRFKVSVTRCFTTMDYTLCSRGVKDMTIDELKSYCDEEFANIDRVRGELSSVYSPGRSGYTLPEVAAMASFIMNIYTGIEKVLKQMLVYDRLDVGDAPGWHEKVLKKAGEIGILPPDLFQILTGYLSFRNYFLYNYVFNIKLEDMKVLIEAIDDVITRFKKEVEEYIQML